MLQKKKTRVSKGKPIFKGAPLEDKIAFCESFLDENGAQFLLSTTAGGEGINLQVCRILFNYDLPWNPMAVEQRIGRIHRYGQTETNGKNWGQVYFVGIIIIIVV